MKSFVRKIINLENRLIVKIRIHINIGSIANKTVEINEFVKLVGVLKLHPIENVSEYLNLKKKFNFSNIFTSKFITNETLYVKCNLFISHNITMCLETFMHR
jgi:hypothetical protein